MLFHNHDRLRHRRDDEFWQRPDDFHGFQADGNNLSDEAHDVFSVVGAVGIVNDAAALVGRDLVLVDDPFQRRAVAEAIVVRLCWNALQRQEFVVDERGLVLAEAHLFDAPVQLPFFDALQRVFGLLFVVDVKVGESASGLGESPEHLVSS